MPGKTFEPVTKPSMSNGIVGKAPAVGRHAYGVFTSSSSNAAAAAPGVSKAGHTSNGIRNNTINATTSGANNSSTIQNNPGMAESLRAQIATPRNNSVNLEE